jgi:hypothetical protein
MPLTLSKPTACVPDTSAVFALEQVREFLLKDACNNVRTRVNYALLHVQFNASSSGRRSLAEDPLRGYSFRPPNQCAADTTIESVEEYRGVVSTIYGDFTGNFQAFHDRVLLVQKILMEIERLLEEDDIQVRHADSHTSMYCYMSM